MMTMEYVMNAVRSPTCTDPSSTPCPPTQTMRTDTPFMISIITGIMKFMVRFVNICVRIRSLFARSNRAASCACRPKARMGMTPVSSSRATRFSLSTRPCIRLNFGYATTSSTAMQTASARMATTMVQLICDPVWITLMTPATARIGA